MKKIIKLILFFQIFSPIIISKINNPTSLNKISTKKIPAKIETKNIYLNFENAELSNFINYIGDLKKLNLIPHATVAGSKISLTIREPLSIEGAWKVFLTVIEMAGFSIIKRGNVNVVIKKDKKNISRQPLKSYINIPIKDLPDSDINIRYVTFLKNINVSNQNVQNLLKSMLSTDQSISVQLYPKVNGMIITDKSYNIKSAMKVIMELDQIGLQETVVVMRLKKANASDVKNLLIQFIPQPLDPLSRIMGRAEKKSRYFASATKIIAETRTNSLILMGPKQAIKKIEDFITQNIDTELKDVESPIHIYDLQNTDATSITNLLNDILSQINEKVSKDQSKKYGAVRGGVRYFKPMTIKEDTEGNRLVVAATDKQDWKLLKQTIKDLDKPQPQVAVETLIVSVKLDRNRTLGGAIRNKNEGQIGKGINFQSPREGGIAGIPSGSESFVSILGNMAEGISAGLGSTILTLGKNGNIWGIFKALQTITHTRLLSQPFFTVANNHQANITIGETIYITKESTESGFSGKEAASANTNITITPQINLDGIMRLTIDVKFNEFKDASGAQDAKTLKTDVTVADGQVLILGGFVTNTIEENSSKTPILGDIPILGWIFKQKTKSTSKEHVFILISPTIIKPRTTPGTGLYTRMKLHNAKKDVKNVSEIGSKRDPIQNWFFDPKKEDYSHKVSDFATAKFQPTTADIKYDPYYRIIDEEEKKEKKIFKKITAEKQLAQKRKKLKQLISAKPIVKEKSKRNKIKKLLSTPTNSISTNVAKNTINNKKNKSLLKNFNYENLGHLKKRKSNKLKLKKRSLA